MPKLASMELDDSPVIEKCEGFTGVDSFTRATQLPRDVMAVMENAITKDNYTPQTRYGFNSLSGAVFGGGKVQGLGWFDAYVSATATKLLIAAVNGALYKWDGNAKTALTGYAPNDATLLLEMAMGLNKMFFVDGTQDLYYFDAASNAITKIPSTDPAPAAASGAPPKGASIILWHAGLQRLLLAGVVSFPGAVWVSDVINADNGGWDWSRNLFQPGYGEGDSITAMFELPGNRVAFGKTNGISVYVAPPLANTTAQWQSVWTARGIGVVGKRAVVTVGNDAHIFTQEGVRCLSRMEADGNNYEISPPISIPMQTYVNRINWQYASKIFGFKYRNFVLWGVPLDSATEPDHIMVLNMRLRDDRNPYGKWCGVWKSLTPCCAGRTAFNANERLVLGDFNGKVKEWWDYKDEALPTTFQDDATNFTTLFRTKSFVYGENESPKDGEFYWAEFTADSQSVVTVSIVLDETEARLDTHNLARVQNQLPVNLPFDLAVLKPSTKTESLIGLENFKEQYFEWSCAAGKMALKRFVAGAFINPLSTDPADNV